jgi:hypothetical protein
MLRRGRLGAQGPSWAVKSVSLRTRDGPARLDQVYRRLLADGLPPDAPLFAGGNQPPLRRPLRDAADDKPGR